MTAAPVLIAGGGIGGLAAAIGLARIGRRVLVLEKAARLGEIGAGIQLGPNAFHAFDCLGIGDAARASAVYFDNLRLMDAPSGAEITRIPLGDAFRARTGNPYAVVHRGDLHGVLLRACAADDLVELRTGSAVRSYARDGAGVTAILQDGSRLSEAALIGADGLGSQVRRQMLDDGPPRVSGHSTYRSVIPTEQMPADLRWNAATLWAGPKCHIVHYPLSGWTSFNLVVTHHDDAPEPVASRPVDRTVARRGFDHLSPVARQVIERGRDWKLWVLCDRDPLLTWTDGRVALPVDAAHPMLPCFAQGACMAMEDAVCLAAQVAAHGDDVATALTACQEARRLRTARVQLQSREIGRHVYRPAGAHAALRNRVMRARTPEQWYDQLDWLYAGTGPEGAVSPETVARR